VFGIDMMVVMPPRAAAREAERKSLVGLARVSRMNV